MPRNVHHRGPSKPGRLLGFERKSQPLQTPAVFAQRVAASMAAAMVLIALSLLAGMAGYRHFENMPWVDAFANAAMILSGMGPLTPLETYGGKVFAGVYALYSGLALILAAGLMFAPIVHRVLHRFHIDFDDAENGSSRNK